MEVGTSSVDNGISLIQLLCWPQRQTLKPTFELASLALNTNPSKNRWAPADWWGPYYVKKDQNPCYELPCLECPNFQFHLERCLGVWTFNSSVFQAVVICHLVTWSLSPQVNDNGDVASDFVIFTDLHPLSSKVLLGSPTKDFKSGNRASQHIRTTDMRLSSCSPNSIPSSPASVYVFPNNQLYWRI